MRYRKKPVIIDALEWTEINQRAMFEFLGENFYIDNRVEGGLIIKTLEGEHVAAIGDYIIKGIQGEFYPCKPDIFAKTYEKVREHEI